MTDSQCVDFDELKQRGLLRHPRPLRPHLGRDSPAMSGPVAHGTPWFQRARYVTAPLRSPFVPIRAITGCTVDDSPCSILVVDDGVPIKLLLAGMLAERTQTVSLGKFSILSVPTLVRREGANH